MMIEHVNDGGAEQYTKYMSRYLADRYDLPDHRGQDGYESWETALEEYKENIQNYNGNKMCYLQVQIPEIG